MATSSSLTGTDRATPAPPKSTRPLERITTIFAAVAFAVEGAVEGAVGVVSVSSVAWWWSS